MIEQPKPLSAEEVEWVRHKVVYGGGGPGWPQTRKVLRSLLATLDAESARADAAQKSCEDWQECAGHLALALKNQFLEESRTDEMREALAEFDRLAGEATKGVEF